MKKNSLHGQSQKILILGGESTTMLNFREYLIKDLVARGYQVYCLAQGYTEEDRTILASWGAVAVDSPLNCKGLNPFSDIFAVFKLRQLFKSIKPDVVFSYFVKPVIFGTIAARLAKVPRVIGMIEGLGNAFTPSQNGFSRKAKIIQKIQVMLYKIALPKLDVLLVLNPDDKKDLVDAHNIKVKKTLVLGGIGLNLGDFPYTSIDVEKPVSFIFIARLLKEKGVFEYLQAAEIIKKQYPDTIFYLLGGFDEQNPFALQPQDLQKYLDKNIVEYPGHVDNVHEWIAKSTVFVLPSYYREGIPRSTQEAMAIGRAVITTDVPGCRETVIDGENGFLIPPWSATILAEKMMVLIEKPQLAQKMGDKGYKMAVEKYDARKINQQLIALLNPSSEKVPNGRLP